MPNTDRRQRLEVIRDQLTDAMAEADVAVKAQVAGQLRQVLREIDELSQAQEGTTADDIADRVGLRLAHSNTSPRARRTS